MEWQPLLTSVSTSSVELCQAGREPMLLSTGNANYRNCKGTFRFSNCTMMPAVLEYDVTIKGNTITYTSPTNLNRVAGLADNYCSNTTVLATTGFLGLLEPYTRSNGFLGRWHHLPPGKHPIEVPFGGSFNSFSASYVEITPGNDLCTLTTRDPMDDIIMQFNDILFRGGLIAGSWAKITDLLADSPFPVHQAVQATMTKEENVFHSDIRWFLAAAAFQIFTMLLILPAYWGKFNQAYSPFSKDQTSVGNSVQTVLHLKCRVLCEPAFKLFEVITDSSTLLFLGWWNIGVELTLSPFHTAKAFDAPLLRAVNSAGGSTGVVEEAGDMHLKLGAVDVHRPEHNAVDIRMKQHGTNRSRIGIDTPEKVIRPLKGARFTD